MAKLRIFLSHKEVDRSTASKIAAALRQIGGSEITVSISGEQPGTDYRTWIEAELEQADWYILAFTEPARNWDWCLYEAGYFEAAKKRDKEKFRIICLHPSDERPKPLDKFDSIRINKTEKLNKFCDEFLKVANPELPLDDKITLRDKLGEQIADAFKNVMKTIWRSRRITITIPDPNHMSPNELPDGAQFSGTMPIMADIFGIATDNTTWSRVKMTPAATRDPRWSVQLAHGVANLNKGELPPPITGQILTKSRRVQVLPVLNRIDMLEDHSYSCEILLAEGISTRWAELRNQNVRALVTSLRMTVRFRYDLIETFAGRSGELRFIINDRSPKQFRETIRTLLFDITSEAQANGLGGGKHLLVDCFEDENERAEISKLYDVWEREVFPQLMSTIGMSLDPEVWTQFDETPFENDEIQSLERQFDAMRSMNTRYLELALNRYRELLVAGKA